VYLELLGVLPETEHDRVVSACKELTFAARDVIWAEGDPGDCLHMIESGRVAVRATTPWGASATFGILGPGQSYGEHALVGDGEHRRTSSVVALEPTVVLALDAEDFEELRTQYPSIDRVLVEVLSARVSRLSAHLVEALYAPVEQRVARRLLILAGMYGGMLRGTVVPLTTDDIAGLAGTTTSTVTDVVAQLEAAALVAVRDKGIEILDAGGLAARCG
jgi:CRP-like cAMP-binding protein